MAPHWRRRIILAIVAAAAIGAAIWALRPQPIPVDMVEIARGTLEVTVSEEARTRVRDVYTVSSPLGGTVQRSPREVGDEVVGGETLVAVIRPTAPEFLDARTRREVEAMVAAAESTVELARAQVREATSQLAHAESEYTRAAQLRRRGTISESRFEEVRLGVDMADARLSSAEATFAVRQRELDTARARLIGPDIVDVGTEDAEDCCIMVRAPIDGSVLAVHHESEQVIVAGTPLVDIGDPRAIEIVAELLSSDAVRVSTGAAARVDGWGGSRELEAHVRRVEPAGFTKVSALGIEEQRVRVVLDLDVPPEERPGLGHGYRVVTHIAVERIEDAVLVPVSALFRRGAAWSVFVVENDTAVERVVAIGERTGREAVVTGGLEAGERLVVHPGDRVANGVRVVARGE